MYIRMQSELNSERTLSLEYILDRRLRHALEWGFQLFMVVFRMIISIELVRGFTPARFKYEAYKVNTYIKQNVYLL